MWCPWKSISQILLLLQKYNLSILMKHYLVCAKSENFLEKIVFQKGKHLQDTSVKPNALTKHFPQTTRASDFSQ